MPGARGPATAPCVLPIRAPPTLKFLATLFLPLGYGSTTQDGEGARWDTWVTGRRGSHVDWPTLTRSADRTSWYKARAATLGLLLLTNLQGSMLALSSITFGLDKEGGQPRESRKTGKAPEQIYKGQVLFLLYRRKAEVKKTTEHTKNTSQCVQKSSPETGFPGATPEREDHDEQSSPGFPALGFAVAQTENHYPSNG
ncbi:hypothetical protein E5288_WYG020492 [Bos mutus]|uniref:Uncharacterized protein n=1 Tax=Bos mutus TaxID=72004 RepID=A0A6B0SCG7_9CETA|nr:hypothetical protein [Bos mutus]